MECSELAALIPLLMDLTRQVAGGKYKHVDDLLELTRPGKYPPAIGEPAESFGMMIIFRNENPRVHAANAVRAAFGIRNRTSLISERHRSFLNPHGQHGYQLKNIHHPVLVFRVV